MKCWDLAMNQENDGRNSVMISSSSSINWKGKAFWLMPGIRDLDPKGEHLLGQRHLQMITLRFWPEQ